MVVDSILPHAEFGPNDHRKDAPSLSLIITLTIFFPYSPWRSSLSATANMPSPLCSICDWPTISVVMASFEESDFLSFSSQSIWVTEWIRVRFDSGVTRTYSTISDILVILNLLSLLLERNETFFVFFKIGYCKYNCKAWEHLTIVLKTHFWNLIILRRKLQNCIFNDSFWLGRFSFKR